MISEITGVRRFRDRYNLYYRTLELDRERMLVIDEEMFDKICNCNFIGQLCVIKDNQLVEILQVKSKWRT